MTGATVSVRRCIDGTFAAAGGTVTEDTGGGSSPGFYKFAMAQADTNGNDIGLAFTATGAITVEKTLVTTAGDPTDSVRFGLTALPNAAANAAGGLPVSIAGALDLDEMNADIEAIQTAQLTAAQIATGIWQDTTAGDFTTALSVGKSLMNGVTLGTGLTIASVSGAVGSVTAGVTVTTNNDKTGYTVSTNSDKTGYTLSTTGNNAAADAILDRDMSTGVDSGSPTVRTLRQAARFLRNKWTVAAGTLTVFKEDDATTSWTGAVSTDAAAVPIIGNDPA